MPLGLIMGLGRAFRRKRTASLDILSPKRAPRKFLQGEELQTHWFPHQKRFFDIDQPWKIIENTSDPRVKEIGELAVSEYNKRSKKNLVFQTGTFFDLVLAAKDDSSPTAPSRKYKVTVWDKFWAGIMKLYEFLEDKN
ncbi:hypothetical protein M0R45_027453 [Rubus argutus]|uniref:Cystatin domain-containing protein n=1 Tax=Rubus argutus TaxID=59490 RepID=A0AAW1X254_RUBAR